MRTVSMRYLVWFTLVAAVLAHPVASLGADSKDAEYLVITSRTLAPAFKRLIDYRKTRFKSKLITVEQIEADVSYTGKDTPAKIRECIRRYWSKHGTKWVVFGGDDKAVPVRLCRPKPTGVLIPTDLYLADMDGGDWDKDGDGVYGEPEDLSVKELTPEVIFGRIPVRTAEQVAAYIAKLRRYDRIGADSGFSDSMLLVGGGDDIARGEKQSRGFHQYPVISYFTVTVLRRYFAQIQPTFPAVPLDFMLQSVTSWDRQTCGDYPITNLPDKLNRGYHFVLYNGHGGSGTWAQTRFAVNNASALTNRNPSIVFTVACNTCDYDGREDPCMSEAWIRNPKGGAVAYFGFTNVSGLGMGWTRYVRPVMQNVCGPDRQTLGVAYCQMLKREASRVLKNGNLTFHCKFALHGDPAITPRPSNNGRKLQIISPVSRETYELGHKEALTIRWNAIGKGFTATDRVRLDYSDNGGRTWQSIHGADALPYDKRVHVIPTEELSPGTDYRLRVTSIEAPNIRHSSPKSFSVVRTLVPVTVTSEPVPNIPVNMRYIRTPFTLTLPPSRRTTLNALGAKNLRFVRWKDTSGRTLSKTSSYQFTVRAKVTVIAEYEKVEAIPKKMKKRRRTP